jgi:hypothetical protein
MLQMLIQKPRLNIKKNITFRLKKASKVTSKLNKEYKEKFNELRIIINSWELISGSPEDEFDAINHLLLSQLDKGSDKLKISKAIQFELLNNYGFSLEHIDSKKMTVQVLEWWKDCKK